RRQDGARGLCRAERRRDRVRAGHRLPARRPHRRGVLPDGAQAMAAEGRDDSESVLRRADAGLRADRRAVGGTYRSSGDAPIRQVPPRALGGVMSFVVCVLVLFPLLLLFAPRFAMIALVAAIVWQVIDRTRSAP